MQYKKFEHEGVSYPVMIHLHHEGERIARYYITYQRATMQMKTHQ